MDILTVIPHYHYVASDAIIKHFQSWFKIFYSTSAAHSKSKLAIKNASIWITPI